MAHKAVKPAPTRFVKDTKQTNKLIKASRLASENAIREAKALGLSITYMLNGILYLESPDGTRVQIEGHTKQRTKRKAGTLILKKGMILHANK